MRLNPQQAPLYGKGLLTVQLCDGELYLDEGDVEFYLLFTGSTQRHLATTLKSSHATLQTICPSHNCCESVQVTLYAWWPGRPMEHVAEGHLCFVQDLAYDMAQFLVGATGQPDGLEGLLQLDECQVASCEREQLDYSLALALQHLALPKGWNVLSLSLDSEPIPQETLLHFAARRGLPRVAAFLLQCPGGREALKLPNQKGETPFALAEARGYTQLQHLLTQSEESPGPENEASLLTSTEGHAVWHHRRLNTYTLTVSLTKEAPPASLEDVDKLRRMIHCIQEQGSPSFQVASELLHTTLQCCDSPREQAEEKDLLYIAQQGSDSSVSFNENGQQDGGKNIVGNCVSVSEGLQLPSDNGISEGWVCPCQDSCVECTKQVERELGPALVGIVDSKNGPNNSESLLVWEEGLRPASGKLSCRGQQEEADISQGTISATQQSLEGDSKENQEVASKAERAEEVCTCDNSDAALGGSKATENMGNSQYQNDQGISDGGAEDHTSQETRQIDQSMTEVKTRKHVCEDPLQEPEGETESGEVSEEMFVAHQSSVSFLGLQGSTENEEGTVESECSSAAAADPGSAEAQCESEKSHFEQSQETPVVGCVEAEGDNGSDVNCECESGNTEMEKHREAASGDEPSSDTVTQHSQGDNGEGGGVKNTGCTEESSCEFGSQVLLNFSSCEETLLQIETSSADGDHKDLQVPTVNSVLESSEPLTIVKDCVFCCVPEVETNNMSGEDKGSICDITDVTSFSTSDENSSQTDAVSTVAEEQGAHISSDVMSTQDVRPEETNDKICLDDAADVKPDEVHGCAVFEDSSQCVLAEQGAKDLSDATSMEEVGPGQTVEDEGSICVEECTTVMLNMPPNLHLEEDKFHSENGSSGRNASGEVISIEEVDFQQMVEDQQNVCAEDAADVKLDTVLELLELPFTDNSIQSFSNLGVGEEQVINIPNHSASTLEIDAQEKREPLEESTFSPSKTEPPSEVVSKEQEGSDCGEVPKASPAAEADLQLPSSEKSAKIPVETSHVEDHLSQQELLEENNGSELRRDDQENTLHTDIIVQKPSMSSDSQNDEVQESLGFPERTKLYVDNLIIREEEVDSHFSQGIDPETSVDVTSDTAVVVMNSEELSLKSLPVVLEEIKDHPVDGPTGLMTSKAVSEYVSEQKDIGTAAAEFATPEAPRDRVHLELPTHALEENSLQPASAREGCDSLGPGVLGGFSSTVDKDRDLVVGLELPRMLDMVEEVSEEGSEDSPDIKTDNIEASCGGTDGLPTIPNSEREAPTAGVQAMSAVLGTHKGNTNEIHREKDTCYSADSCIDPSDLGKIQRSECPESPESLIPQAAGSSGSTALQDSGSDADGLFCSDLVDDSVFQKAEGTPAGDSISEASASCSSTDDTASTGPTSSALGWSAGDTSWSSEEARPAGDLGGEAEEEAKDRLTEVPIRSAILRSSVRSLSPFRRHSWEPGRNSGREAQMSPRSSLRTLGEGRPAFHKRSMSWCPSDHPCPDADEVGSRSYSLEGLSTDGDAEKEAIPQAMLPQDSCTLHQLDSKERGSLGSLTEEEQESHLGDCSSLDNQKSTSHRPMRYSNQSMSLPLTKSVSMLAISHKELDGMWSSSKTPAPHSYGISDEDPAPLRGYNESKSGTKVSRTFSYLKNKMCKKNKDKDKEKGRGKDQDTKEKEKTLNGHVFSTVNSAPSAQCIQCNKAIGAKEASFCTNCNVHVHKGCRESLPVCAKVKMKQKPQFTVPDSAALPVVTMRQKTTPSRERPRSAILVTEDPSAGVGFRRPTSIIPFQSSNLSKSVSISNIAGPVLDDMPLNGLKYLSQSTDSLHKASKVHESTESLVDEGLEMMESQLMEEFEPDAKELEADSWSYTVGKDFLKQLKKDVIKRQDVIYELIQTEMHHVRTLKIMANVYSKGLKKEVQMEVQMLERLFPMLDSLLELHSQFFARLLERKRQSQRDSQDRGFIIRQIGDILITQFSDSNAERLKKVYGKFCSRHNEAVSFYKELHAKDKRFQAFVKKKMSSTVVRRLSIPECILLVTQRITKYPVLLQRLLQHTKESEEDHNDVVQALRLVKEVIAAVDSKVNEHEKKQRLREVHGRTDSRSIMRMKSGQMFAREDLVHGRKLLRDGPLQLKTSAGRLKDVHALLLSDVLVFLQEKDQKYVFASLDQRSTVISLQKLIVREMANEERGFFVITAGIEQPEMVEVHASSKEERNTWMQLIQDAMHSMAKDDKEVHSETEEDRRLLESKTKEMRDLLRKKDEQIATLLEEKVKLFRDMCDVSTPDVSSPRTASLFRTIPGDMPKGEPIIMDALKIMETLQMLVNGESPGCGVGPVCLPRRSETFGGFDSHQMNTHKNGEKGESEDCSDLRRTESDSVLKKGGDASLPLHLKRNSEQLLHSVTHLYDLLSTLQVVVVQQDSLIEDQRHMLSEKPSSRPASRPNSLVEQEKQRSLEKQRQEAAELYRQQTAHVEERRRRERDWEDRERQLAAREAQLQGQEEEARRLEQELEEARRELQEGKEEYQRDLERLRDAQRKLDRDRETTIQEVDRIPQMGHADEKRKDRTPSSTSDDSLRFQSTSSLDRDPGECERELSSSPGRDSLMRMGSKRKGRSLNLFSSSSSHKAPGSEGQNLTRLLPLAKTKEKKDKKKKKGKGSLPQSGGTLTHTLHHSCFGTLPVCFQ
ncbi:A-kinase anchor protein 13-like isoform X2 [Scleropages formosus]|uniref:A-kinase anchor protein 13-like isoform X2 n=1 Tax=Scleropages formosus TaxID=113540 RepID=UPI0010FA86E6|nr:A-kinase anchor protein 13-like isoform X2 [Scleropages formosus]